MLHYHPEVRQLTDYMKVNPKYPDSPMYKLGMNVAFIVTDILSRVACFIISSSGRAGIEAHFCHMTILLNYLLVILLTTALAASIIPIVILYSHLKKKKQGKFPNKNIYINFEKIPSSKKMDTKALMRSFVSAIGRLNKSVFI